MKKLLFTCSALLLILCLVFAACKKSSTPAFQSKGVITLTILYTCENCPGGGYYIKFNNDTAAAHHIDNDLTPFGVTPVSKFPLTVDVNWKNDNATGAVANSVIITALKVDN